MSFESFVGSYLKDEPIFLSDPFCVKSAHNPQFRHETIEPTAF